MTSASSTPSGCIVSVGLLAGGVAGAQPPANSLQASGLLWSFYSRFVPLGKGDAAYFAAGGVENA